jgi:hypothetical protein
MIRLALILQLSDLERQPMHLFRLAVLDLSMQYPSKIC